VNARITCMAELIQVEVAFAAPARQKTVELSVPEGTTIAEVIAVSGLAEDFPEFDFESLSKGIWGEKKSATHIVSTGDRVEIYRPLSREPMQARRERAQQKAEEKRQKKQPR